MDTITNINVGPDAGLSTEALLQLLTWLSPSFPVGAYSYSHGIEYAVEANLVTDRESLQRWIAGVVTLGAGRIDAELFRTAHEAVTTRDESLMIWALERGDALRSTAELGRESEGQGQAFMLAVAGPWSADGLDWLHIAASAQQRPVVYPIAVGGAAAAHAIPVAPALTAYLHALTANLVSAGVRLIPLGQSDGQRAIAWLVPTIRQATQAALARTREDIGAAALMVDWTSAKHETQYTRLFRS